MNIYMYAYNRCKVQNEYLSPFFNILNNIYIFL